MKLAITQSATAVQAVSDCKIVDDSGVIVIKQGQWLVDIGGTLSVYDDSELFRRFVLIDDKHGPEEEALLAALRAGSR